MRTIDATLLTNQKGLGGRPAHSLVIGTAPNTVDVTAYLLEYVYRETAHRTAPITITLDNKAGTFNTLSGDLANIAQGAAVALQRGVTVAGSDYLEALPRFWIEELAFDYGDSQSTFVLHCVDWWALLERHREASETTWTTQTVTTILEALLAYVSLTRASGAMTALTLTFILSLYESAASAVRRLMSKVPEYLYSGLASEVKWREIDIGDASVYTLGWNAEHPVLETRSGDRAWRYNSVTVYGNSPWHGAASDATQIALVGTRRLTIFDNTLNSNADCSVRAQAELDFYAVEAAVATISCRPIHGLEMFDVLKIDDPPWGGADVTARVVYYEEIYANDGKWSQWIGLGGPPRKTSVSSRSSRVYPDGSHTHNHDTQLTGVSPNDHHDAFIGLEDHAYAAVNPAADDRIRIAAGSGISVTAGAATITIGNTGAVVGSHTLLGSSHSDTTTDSPTRGSIIRADATPEWDELLRGAAGTYLRSDGTDVGWSTVSHDDDVVDVSEDDHHAAFIGLEDHAYTAVTPAADNRIRLAAGSGISVTASSATITIAATGGVGAHNLLGSEHSDTTTDSPTRGSIVRANSTPAWDELTIGASGRYLRSDGTDVAWAEVQGGDLPDHASRHEVGGADLVNHDDLTGFVANEHIDHTSVDITAGDGLTGGGDISATRTVTMGTPGTLTSTTSNGVTATSHTHDITTTWYPGAGAYILASNSDGHIRLQGLGVAAAPVTNWVTVASAGYVGYDAGANLRFYSGLIEATGDLRIEGRGADESYDLQFSDTGGTEWHIKHNSGEFRIVETGVSTRFSIAAGGNVGIGKTGPSSALDINLATQDLEIVDAGTAGATDQAWVEVEHGGTTGYLRIQATP